MQKQLDRQVEAKRLALDHIFGHVDVADGTFESVCVAWGSSYGHDALTAAVIRFTTDADQAVDQLAARGEAIAVTLVEQAETYRAIDAGTQQRFVGPGIGPTSPLLPPSPFGGAPVGRRASLSSRSSSDHFTGVLVQPITHLPIRGATTERRARARRADGGQS